MKPVMVMMALLASLAACRPSAHLPTAPSQTFGQAEDALARRHYEAAAVAYRRFLSGTPDPAYVPRAYYQLALAEYSQHHYDDALATLDEMTQRAPQPKAVQIPALRGDTELALGNRTSAVLDWEHAWRLAGSSEQPRLRARLVSVAPQLTEEERAELSQSLTVADLREMLGLGEPGAAAPMPEAAPAGQLGAPAEEAEETAASLISGERAPSAAVAAPPLAAAEPEAPSVTAGLPEPVGETTATTRVACLLPLSGPDHAYGLRALAGLRLAFADAPEQLVVRDTGGDPASSAELLRDLRNDPTVVAVIGPLRSSEAEATAPVAERAQVPLLLLSQREGLTGHFVLQAAMTRTQQVRLLVRYAVETLKLRRFGILFPNDGYGSAFADAFKQEVTRHGAGIAGAQAYEAGAPNLAGLSATVQRWHRAGLDGVFIPDAAAAATAVGAAVREEVPDVALFGTESWNDASTLANAGPSINGAVFADAFFVDSSRPSTQRFVERFEHGAGRSPTVFEAQAFDAGMVVRRTIAEGAASRDQVIAQLAALGSFEGAGALRSSPSGFERAVSILRYRDGKVEEAMMSDP